MTRRILALGALPVALALFGCSVSHGAGGEPPADGGSTRDASALSDSGASDAGEVVLCGDHACPAGEYCCNASCGICAPPGAGCIAIECVDAGSASDGGSPAICGTIAGLVCGAGEYCEYGGDPYCGGDDGGGYCLPRPTSCPEIYRPVCGCDRVTYGNECEAHAAGVGVSFPSPCETPPPPRDCRTTGCGAGYSCQLCWADYACLPDGAVC